MVRKISAFFLILTSMCALADEAQFVREALVNICRVVPSECVDHHAWAQTAATLHDQKLIDLLFNDYYKSSFDQRVPTLEKLKALESEFPACDSLLNSLAWNRYRMGIELEYALTLVKRIQNHTESTFDTLAVLKLKCGYPAESLQIFLDLLPHLQIDLPPNPKDKLPDYYQPINCIATITIYDHAADTFYKNGHLREAAKLWSKTHQLIQRMQRTFDFDVTTFPIYDFNYPRFQQKYKAIRTLLKVQRATSET